MFNVVKYLKLSKHFDYFMQKQLKGKMTKAPLLSTCMFDVLGSHSYTSLTKHKVKYKAKLLKANTLIKY